MTTNRSDKNGPGDGFEREFAKKLTGYLDLSTADIKAGPHIGSSNRAPQSSRAWLMAGARTAPASRYAPALAGSGGRGGNAGNRTFIGNNGYRAACC